MNLSVTTVYFVRHGQTPNNVVGALDTALPGAGLTDLGHRQAEDLVRRFHDRHIDRIVTSCHERARLTATPLAQDRGLALTQDAGFGEIEAGALEMATTRAAAEQYLGTAFAWATGDLTPRLPGGPDGRTTIERFTRALDSALDGLDDDATLVVVSHGAIIRLWVTAQVDGITPKEVENRHLPNTAALQVRGRPGAWRYVDWEDPTILDPTADDPTSHAEEN